MIERPYDGCGRCLVGVRRLSRKSDASSSPERQRTNILTATEAVGGHIIDWADDWEISGATDPLTRPAFGPWLRNERGPYDGIVGAAVDRIGRNVRDVLNTAYAIHERGQLLVTYGHDGPWDLDDPVDESRLTMEAFGSQMELRAIQRRNRDATVKMRAAGRPKGKPAYGFQFVRDIPTGPVSHVVQHEHAAGILRTVAERILADQTGEVTPHTEATRLTRLGELSPSDHLRALYGKPPQGTAWNGPALRRMLLSEAAMGYLMHGGRPVVGTDGKPVRLAPGIWDHATHDALKTKLARGPRKTEPAPSGEHLLSGRAVCGVCGHRLYATWPRKGQGASWTCTSRRRGLTECKPSPTVRMEVLDAEVETWFLTEVGPLQIMHKIYDPGSGQPARIQELEAARERLRQDRQAGLYDAPDDADWFRAQYAAMGREIAALSAEEVREPGMRSVPTGRTVWDDWHAAKDNPAARRGLLASFGVTVRVSRASAAQRFVIDAEFDGAPVDDWD
ncbi:recombinase family protein [Streptomyces sp. NPDC002992]|uniref:recombinase family protein n=1 Tax=Streptomyces sp. NPDC002992 TaxID=3154273 RepID=UPI0033ABE363